MELSWLIDIASSETPDHSSVIATARRTEVHIGGETEERPETGGENAAVAKGSAVKTLCKRDPEAVRRILGLDGKLNAKSAPLLAPGAARQERLNAEDQNAALADADRMIRKGLEFTSDLDGYVEANEKWLRAVSAIDSATYSSRSQDLGAVISTTAGGAEVLDSALSSVVEARDALRVVVKLRSM